VNLRTRPDVAALVFCGVVVLACAVLAALGRPIPDFLPAVGMFVAGVGGGAALNAPPAAAAASSEPAAAPAAPVPAPRQGVAVYTDEPTTGVFGRVAVHE
jgi:hypothetical protein